jgi:hypothetical protein
MVQGNPDRSIALHLSYLMRLHQIPAFANKVSNLLQL